MGQSSKKTSSLLGLGGYGAVFDDVKPCHHFHHRFCSHIELALFDCPSNIPGPVFHCAPDLVDVSLSFISVIRMPGKTMDLRAATRSGTSTSSTDVEKNRFCYLVKPRVYQKKNDSGLKTEQNCCNSLHKGKFAIR